jgi:hypothetical protein
MACGAVACISVISLWDPDGMRCSGLEAAIPRGRVFLARVPPPVSSLYPLIDPVVQLPRADRDELFARIFALEHAHDVISAVRDHGPGTPSYAKSGAYWAISIPLWIAFALFATPTAILWWRDSVLTKRDRAGRCPKCGYDRHGLSSPTVACPECGTVPARG